jgi:hypothetical protein
VTSGYDAVYYSGYFPTFRRNVLPPTSWQSLSYPKDRFFRNVGIYLPGYTALHTRRVLRVLERWIFTDVTEKRVASIFRAMTLVPWRCRQHILPKRLHVLEYASIHHRRNGYSSPSKVQRGNFFLPTFQRNVLPRTSGYSLLYPEDVGSRFLRKVCIHVPEQCERHSYLCSANSDTNLVFVIWLQHFLRNRRHKTQVSV